MGKKKQPQSLTDFLKSSTATNWADEEEDLMTGTDSLTAAQLSDPFLRKKRGEYEEYSTELPTKKPFAVRVHNIPYTWLDDEEIVESFFKECKLEEVHVVPSKTKGNEFAYVSFDDIESLKKALALTGTKIGSAQLKIQVSFRSFIPPQSRNQRETYEKPVPKDSVADKDMHWRRGASTNKPSSSFSKYNKDDQKYNRYRNSDGRSPTSREHSSTTESKFSSMSLENKEEKKPGEKEIIFAGRPKLNLKPRTIPDDQAKETPESPSKDNPFGDSKPVETTPLDEEEKVRKMQEKLLQNIQKKEESVKSEPTKETTEEEISPGGNSRYESFGKARGRGRGRGRGGRSRGRGRGFHSNGSWGNKDEEGFTTVQSKSKEGKYNRPKYNNPKYENRRRDDSSPKPDSSSNSAGDNPFALLGETNE